MAQKELPNRPSSALDRLMRVVQQGKGITLDPATAIELAEGVSTFINKFAMAQHRLDIQSRVTTALVTLLVGKDDEPLEISSEKFEKAQESTDGYWVYYRPSTDSLLVGLGQMPEDIIEDNEVEATVVDEEE